MKATISLIFFLGVSLFSKGQSDDIDVLFVGNSYTYFWNLPQNVHLLAESQDISINTRQSTSGGRTLEHHWNRNRNLATKDIISEGEFDIVVIQNHSMRALTKPDSMLFYGEQFGRLIKKSGAKTYIYSTWSRKFDPYMVKTISRVDSLLAKNIGATIVPAGLTWAKAMHMRPDLPLYEDDNSHPSPLGTYLNACLFYSVITGNTPVGLPNRLVTTDADGEKLYINIQSASDALFCQKVVADVLGLPMN